MGKRPFAWEASYPPGVIWDAPITPFTLVDLIDNAANDYGDRAAIECRNALISYRSLGEMVTRMAAGLAQHGIKKGDRVALYMPNSPAHPIAFFGALKAGAIVVQLSPLDAMPELLFKLDDAQAHTLITTNIDPLLPAAMELLAQGALVQVIVIEDEMFGAPEGPRAPAPTRSGVTLYSKFDTVQTPSEWPRVTPDDIALLQYTGGTTGKPKGAILTHANIAAAIDILDATYAPQLALKAGEARAICVLPLFHIFALTTVLLLNLRNGNRISLRMRFNPESAVDDIERLRLTHFSGVPTMWIAIGALPNVEKRDFSSLVLCVSGGAPLPVEVQTRIESIIGQRLNSGWGMTETSPAGIHTPFKGPLPHGSIGLPQPRVEIEIVSNDDPTRVLGPNETGEIRIKGPNITSGYWNRPEDSKTAFVDGWFLTGDVGFMDENGFFSIVDRKKDLIISSGFKVFPQLVEQAIYEHADVEEVMVIGIPDAYRGESAKAFVKLREGSRPMTIETLTAFLDGKVGRHEMPKEIEVRAFLPRTAVGKLSKKDLREEIAASQTSRKMP